MTRRAASHGGVHLYVRSRRRWRRRSGGEAVPEPHRDGHRHLRSAPATTIPRRGPRLLPGSRPGAPCRRPCGPGPAYRGRPAFGPGSGAARLLDVASRRPAAGGPDLATGSSKCFGGDRLATCGRHCHPPSRAYLPAVVGVAAGPRPNRARAYPPAPPGPQIIVSVPFLFTPPSASSLRASLGPYCPKVTPSRSPPKPPPLSPCEPVRMSSPQCRFAAARPAATARAGRRIRGLRISLHATAATGYKYHLGLYGTFALT